MDLQNYEGTTRVLIDQVLEQKRDMSQEVFGPLEQLLEADRWAREITRQALSK